jgi:hypothetical protein
MVNGILLNNVKQRNVSFTHLVSTVSKVRSKKEDRKIQQCLSNQMSVNRNAT